MTTPQKQSEKLTPDEMAEYEERAAILEFDGHMERGEAEKMALRLTLAKRDKK